MSGSRTAPGYFTGVHASAAITSIARVTAGLWVRTRENFAPARRAARTTVCVPQQRIDVEETAGRRARQQIHPSRERAQMLSRHRFQLFRVPESELAQQCSDRRGCVHSGERLAAATAAQQVDVVNAVRARAHPGVDRGLAMRDVSALRSVSTTSTPSRPRDA